MHQNSTDHPDGKISPEDIDPLFDRRGTWGLPVFTAANVTNILVGENARLGQLHPETTRKHLDRMAESGEWDVRKYSLGSRTVVYGRSDDPERVVGEHSNPGRPRKELREEIIETLHNTDHRAMTLGMVTDEVDASRRTVKDRLDGLVKNGPVHADKIGNATAYYVPEEF